ncbi:MAG: 4-hydroxyphenylacetate catabolism regulatory protein HpaA [Exilibacterium sp.]|uniref:4-hydroxyphenylacetate catabolism regulatory protein HpaA n=1 Tax=Sedimenticola sp. TaxID=1940285 RepID=UPI0030A7B9F3
MKSENASNWIPNINIGQDYDQRYLDASIHYDALENLAVFFGRDMPVHRHAQYLQIHFIKKGNINFHIDDKLFQVAGPSLFLTPPAIPHSFQIKPNAKGHVLTIHQSLIWQIAQRGSRSDEPEFNLNQGICLTESRLCAGQRKTWQFIQQLLENIEEEWHSESLAKALALESFIYLLIIQIARLSGRQVQSSEVNNDDLRLFHQFNRQTELHFREHWQLPKYTEAIGVSESRLNHVCQRISNTSPKKIIRERLLQEIKRLLIFSKLSINEIAYQLGFRDPAYFSRFFKEQTGMTALAWRKQHNKALVS